MFFLFIQNRIFHGFFIFRTLLIHTFFFFLSVKDCIFFYQLLANVLLYTCVHSVSIRGTESTYLFLFFSTQVAVATQLENKRLPSKAIGERINELKKKKEGEADYSSN